MNARRPLARRAGAALIVASLIGPIAPLAGAGPVFAADPTESADPSTPAEATPAPDPTATPDPTAMPTPTPDPTATPDPTPASTAVPGALRALPRPRVFTESTYRSGAFVPQYTITQCVGASIQTMRNQVYPTIDRSRSYQRLLWLRARTYSKYRGDGGADPFGWAASLSMSGAGTYRVVGEPTLAAALWVGAKAMRLTRRPVGALVWNGGHAWSISGFETTADPARTDDFTVTAAYPLDPLYPHYRNRRWPVVAPNQRMTVARLATYLTRYRDPRLDPLVQNLFVLIVPVGADGTVPTPPAAVLPPPVPTPPAPTPAAS